MEKKDELDEIFVDRNEPADRKLLAELLKPFVTIDPEGNLSFSAEYEELEEAKKALIYLLCKKAMILKKMKDITEPSTLKEVTEKAMIGESSAKNALFTYYKGLIKKEGNGYIIPNHKLRKVNELIFEKKGKK